MCVCVCEREREREMTAAPKLFLFITTVPITPEEAAARVYVDNRLRADVSTRCRADRLLHVDDCLPDCQ